MAKTMLRFPGISRASGQTSTETQTPPVPPPAFLSDPGVVYVNGPEGKVHTEPRTAAQVRADNQAEREKMARWP